jgi:hypothetical protein
MERNAHKASDLNGSFAMSHHRRNFGGGGQILLEYFLYVRILLLLLSWRGANKKNYVEIGGKFV